MPIPLDEAAEVWKVIPCLGGYYEASSLGNVRRTSDKAIRKQHHGRHFRYPCVNVCIAGWTKPFTVHSLIADAFLGPRPKGFDVHHIDSDPKNNMLSNLVYVSHTENMRQCAKAGRHHHGETHTEAKLTRGQVLRIRELDASGVTCIEMMEIFGIERKTLYNVRKRQTWKHIPPDLTLPDPPRYRNGQVIRKKSE